MAQPTTGVLFSGSFPPATPGNQLVQPQTNGGQPAQYVTFQPQLATTALNGVVKPDGTTITIDPDGTIHAPSVGGGGGGGGGGTSASSGWLVCVVPAGAKDGSNTQFTLPAPVLAGTGYIYVRNGVTQRQLGTKAEFGVQGTVLTTLTPLGSDDWHEFYYVMGTPNSESGGGGGVTPTPSTLRSTAAGGQVSGSSITVSWPAGAQAGDLAIIFVACGFAPSTPSGWTTNLSISTLNWLQMVCSKILTSADIAAGSVSVSFGGSIRESTYQIAVMIGPTDGIRETDGVGGSGSTASVSTSSAPQAADVALYFGSCSANGTTAGVSTVDRGTLQQQTGAGGAYGSSCLYAELLASSGVVTAGYSYASGGGFNQQAILIIKS